MNLKHVFCVRSIPALFFLVLFITMASHAYADDNDQFQLFKHRRRQSYTRWQAARNAMVHKNGVPNCWTEARAATQKPKTLSWNEQLAFNRRQAELSN